jgi:hypothetical protein
MKDSQFYWDEKTTESKFGKKKYPKEINHNF